MKQKGFINLILLIILALVILYYIHIPLSGILSSPLAGQYWRDTKNLNVVLWQDFMLIVQFIQRWQLAEQSASLNLIFQALQQSNRYDR